jgi:AcrR family transcriptional regulator
MKVTARAKRRQEAKGDLGDRRRDDLIKAAYGLIAKKGLQATRTRDIAERAGVKLSTLHYYFGTKEALLIAVVHHLNEEFAVRQQALGSGGRTWPPSLRSHLDSARQTFQENPDLAIVLQELALRAHRDAAIRDAFRELYNHWNMFVAHILTEEIRGGQRRADLDPEAGAIIVTSVIMGMLTQLGVDASAFDVNKVSKQFEALIGGVRRAPSGRGRSRASDPL